jgi:membrane-associated phospholipid phosphatase
MIVAPSTPTPSRTLVLFLTAAATGTFFVVWSYLALGEGPLFEFDQRCAEFWRQYGEEHALGRSWELAKFLTDMGSIATMGMVAVMGALWQFSHGRRFFGTAWFGIALGGAALNGMLKTDFDRPRPPEEWRDRAVLERNQSYPSGHAMGSTIGYGMLCYALLRQTRFPLRRTLLVLFFDTLVGGIGFSRVYLRAHWFSDVIGGYAVGLCWLTFWLGWLERRRVRGRRSDVAAVRSVGGAEQGGDDTDDADEAGDDG